jgi:hypothetical protein
MGTTLFNIICKFNIFAMKEKGNRTNPQHFLIDTSKEVSVRNLRHSIKIIQSNIKAKRRHIQQAWNVKK